MLCMHIFRYVNIFTILFDNLKDLNSTYSTVRHFTELTNHRLAYKR